MTNKHVSDELPGQGLSEEFKGASQDLRGTDDTGAAMFAPMKVDASRYIDGLDGLDMTEAQKVEFLQVLWSIMSSFVALGFGVDSVIPMLSENASKNGSDALQQTIPTHEFNFAVDDGAQEP